MASLSPRGFSASSPPSLSLPLLRRVLQGESALPPPVWIMRQAGRYLPEYRAVRQHFKNFMEFCLTPDVVTQVTLQPIERFDFDAAIIFCDILMLPHALGQQVDFVEGEGPKLAKVDWLPFLKSARNQSILPAIEPVLKAIRLTREALNPAKSLVGFCGAPWTVACYMIQRGKIGNSSLNLDTPSFNENLIRPLLDVIQQHSVDFLKAQIKAGCDVIQIFDSWAELVPLNLRQTYLWEPLEFIYNNLREHHPEVPIIYYGRGVADHYPFLANQFKEMCFGLDQTVNSTWAAQALHSSIPLQGNLDPLTLVQGDFQQPVETLLTTLSSRPFVFNLGHGILPQTPLAHVYKLLEQIRNYQ